jgi:hypothetical protein
MEIRRVSIDGCRQAWRFSDPEVCDQPTLGSRATEPEEYLIGFYDALAMIQTECFMGQVTHSQAVPLPDSEMTTLEWLHERIRNEYEHFIPKYYSAPVADLLAATRLCLDVSHRLLFESGNVLFFALGEDDLQALFSAVASALSKRTKGEG